MWAWQVGMGVGFGMRVWGRMWHVGVAGGHGGRVWHVGVGEDVACGRGKWAWGRV